MSASPPKLFENAAKSTAPPAPNGPFGNPPSPLCKLFNNSINCCSSFTPGVICDPNGPT